MLHRPAKHAPDNITFAEIERIASDEVACRAFFEHLRFPDGLRCAACGAAEETGQSFTRHRPRPSLFTCCACRRQFTLTSGTALHRTRLPLGQWLRAIWLVAASSKGISARKLSEMLGITYKVAWHLCHRIRAMMTDVNAARNLESGRSAFDRGARHTKAESLQLTVLRHLERDKTRGRVTSAKVFDSPYYRDVAAALDAPPTRKIKPPDVVADVSAG